jgi:hypothetical protein
MIMAVTGSRCSSDGSTTSSRERCSERASDSLSPAARDVDKPHAVLVLIPSVSDVDCVVPHDVPACAERDPPPRSGMTPPPAGLVRPVPAELDWLLDQEAAPEADSPTVLVYDPPNVSVTDVPTVSVSWESTNRWAVPSCSLAALASSALPRRMKAVTAFPRPIRCLTCGGIDR